MTATKATITDEIRDQLNIIQYSQSVEIFETLLEIIKESLESGDDIIVSGFGKFSVKEKRQRKGRNPATGKDMMLDGTFHCSWILRGEVNWK